MPSSVRPSVGLERAMLPLGQGKEERKKERERERVGKTQPEKKQGSDRVRQASNQTSITKQKSYYELVIFQI